MSAPRGSRTDFNPRSREGSDGSSPHEHHRSTISIRAPARGATCFYQKHGLPILFQSALPRGERPNDFSRLSIVSKFQSALPRGERPMDITKVHADDYFNPRSREGSDARRVQCICKCVYFNPRSREGSDINFRQKVLFSLSKNCVIHLFFITNFLN